MTIRTALQEFVADFGRTIGLPALKQAIREEYPDKLLFGNVCCMQTLPHGTLADVEDETLEIIEKIGPQGGIFIGSSSEVHDSVPVENAVKMYQTVHEYGTYPIKIDRIGARRTELRNRGELKLRADLEL